MKDKFKCMLKGALGELKGALGISLRYTYSIY